MKMGKTPLLAAALQKQPPELPELRRAEQKSARESRELGSCCHLAVCAHSRAPGMGGAGDPHGAAGSPHQLSPWAVQQWGPLVKVGTKLEREQCGRLLGRSCSSPA